MIEFGPYNLAAPPRVGGDWVATASELAGLAPQGGPLHTAPFGPGFSVCVVRHPYTWLQSFYWAEVWKREISRELPPLFGQFVELAKNSGSLRAFIKNYLLMLPGGIGAAFGGYRADAVLRMEDFPWNVWEFLYSVGIEPGRAKEATKTPPTNPGRYARLDDNLLRKSVVESEPEFCDMYDYRVW